MPESIKNRDGFTLVEILVAVAIAGVVMAGIYSAYYSQQKSYIAQGEVSDMQQNLRAAMYFMEREIRMAGCDPQGTAGAGITDLGYNSGPDRNTSITFTEDIANAGTGNPNGVIDSDETITYALNGTDLRRNGQVLAQNIEALDFVYLNASEAATTNADDIRAVQITVIARTGKGDPGYVNNDPPFTNLAGKTISHPADNFRRRVSTVRVKCRNLGL